MTLKTQTLKTVLILAMAAGTLTTSAMGQLLPEAMPKGPRPAPEVASKAMPAPWVIAKPTYSEEEFGAIAEMLTGCWKATIPGAGEVVMGVAPVKLNGMNDCLYAELSYAKSMNRPFRQTIWQIHKVNGKVRLKTLEFRSPGGRADHVAGLWAAPDAFPATIGMNDLVATMDMELTKEGDGYLGKTIQPYPTTISGAVEMTGEVKLDGKSFWTADRGFNAEGKQVWGPAAGEGYTFSRFGEGPRTTRIDGGVIVVDYPGATGDPAAVGQQVSVDYIGYLETGKVFDASYERGSPFTYTKGDSKLIEGWLRAMEDARKGQVRRLVIPGALGITKPNGKAPAGSKLIYDVRVVDVGTAAKPAPVIQTSGGVKPVLEPVDPNDPKIQKMQEDMRRRMEEKRRAQEEAAKNGQPLKPAEPPAQPAPKK